MSISTNLGFTELQEIFVIAFPIFFGLMLHFSGGIQAFDTTPVFKLNVRNIARYTISIFILNIAPFAYFALMLVYGLRLMGDFDIYKVIVTLGLAVGVIGFYRIYYAIVTAGKNILYSKGELDQIKKLKHDNFVGYEYHHTQYLFPGLMYIAIPIGIFSMFTDEKNLQLSSLITIIIIIVAGIFCRWIFSDKMRDASSIPT